MKLSTLLALPALLASQAVVAAPVRIMPFGASIVGAPGCWRAKLWQKLVYNKINNFDFVGSMATPNCGFAYDGENEGHAGALATEYVRKNDLPGWLNSAKPDVILMHLGTNDVIQKKSLDDIMKAYDALVAQMRTSNPRMNIIISTLVPIEPTKFGADVSATIPLLNARIKEWGPKKSTALSKVTIVDNFTGFNPSTDTTDGEHPNNNGNIKISDVFWPPLKSAVQGLSR